MFFNQNLGLETIYKEYKSFNFFCNTLLISNEDAIKLVETKEWLFNDDIINTIECMINIFLPKYACAFLSNNDKDAELYFGIDDNGIIHGIPYQGELDKNLIIEKYKKCFYNKIKCTDNIFNYIDIDIIKLDYDYHKKLDDTHYLYKKFINEKIIFNLNYNKYILKKKKWNKLLARYNTKFTDLVNNYDTRLELINYIEIKDPKNCTIKLLKSSYVMLNYKTIDIQIYKLDKNNIFYWLATWKDTMLQFLKSIKPTFYYKIPCMCYPLNIILAVHPMIPYWMHNNTELNLFIIKFTFKRTYSLDIQYKNIYNNWFRCYRTIANGEPCCQRL